MFLVHDLVLCFGAGLWWFVFSALVPGLGVFGRLFPLLGAIPKIVCVTQKDPLGPHASLRMSDYCEAAPEKKKLEL